MQSAIRFFVWRQEKWRSGDRLASQFFEKTINSLELTMHLTGKGTKFPGTNWEQGFSPSSLSDLENSTS